MSEIFFGCFVLFGTFICVAVLVAAAVCWRAYVISILWGWFAIPIFGLPAISMVHAMGIAALASMLTHQYVPSKDKDNVMPLAVAFGHPLMALAMGWILKTYCL